MSATKSSIRKRIEIAVLFTLMALIIGAIHLYVSFYTPASRVGANKVVFIPKGASFRLVASNLEKAGVIRNADNFIFMANFLGAYKKVKAGEYELNSSMTPMEVLDYLIKGRVKKHFVTIPEGYNIKDIALLLNQAGLADDAKFIQKATDMKFVAALGIEGVTLEGYLFPDTYEFTKGMGEEEMIQKMVEEFKAVYYNNFDFQARNRGLDMKKVLTLASIIEKETGAPEERRLISAVFHNRLKKGIKLQSDPTVIYDIKGFDGNLTKSHLLNKSPYNTYAYHGLPPGPIANPGKASINAAINPAENDYLYFVSKNDGTHYFSRDLKEHNKAVSQYQRRFKREAKEKG